MISIPFLKLNDIHDQIKTEIMYAFENVYEQNWFILGRYLQQFEQEYAAFNQTRQCIGTSNGLDALHLCLLALNIGKGDEVILPANTFIATALAVIHAGAIPKFVDPDEYTYNIQASSIAAAISRSTKAIIPVHLYGQACNMPYIIDLAYKNGIYVVEDNAQAQGATFNGKITGSWGDLNATSFYPGKNLGALGDAGAITTNDEVLARKIRTMRNYGSEKKYYHDDIGYNMRMDECQAAFLSVKLKYLMQWIEKRQEIANWYSQRLKSISEITLPRVHESASHVYHLYVVRTHKRDQLQNYLRSNGIDTLIHYPVPLHIEKAFAFLKYKQGSFPIAENNAATCLSLPLWVGMQENDVEIICTHISTFFK